jgi:PAS domain-containing protein
MRSPGPVLIAVMDREEGLFIDARLRAHGFEAHRAESGPEAIRRVQRESFPVAVLDLRPSWRESAGLLLGIRDYSPGTRVLALCEAGPVPGEGGGGWDSVYLVLTRPVAEEALVTAVRRAAEASEMAARLEGAGARERLMRAMSALAVSRRPATEVLEEALRELLAATGLQAAEILLAKPPDNALHLLAHWGYGEDVAEELRAHPLLPGEGAAGRAFQSGVPLVVEDLGADPRFARLAARHEGLRAFVSIPIPGADALLGVLGLFSHRVRTFVPAELETLGTAAGVLGLILDHSLLRSGLAEIRRDLELKTRRRSRQTQLFDDISRLPGGPDRKALIERLLNAYARVADFDLGGAVVCRHWNDGTYLFPRRPVDPAVMARFGRMIEKTFYDQAAADHRYCTGSEPETAPLAGYDAGAPPLTGEPASFISAPILADRTMLGVLAVASLRPGEGDPEHERLLRAMVNHPAVMLLFYQLRSGDQGTLESAMETLPEGILMVDRDRRITMANPAARDILARFGAPRDVLARLGAVDLSPLLDAVLGGGSPRGFAEASLPGRPGRHFIVARAPRAAAPSCSCGTSRRSGRSAISCSAPSASRRSENFSPASRTNSTIR